MKWIARLRGKGIAITHDWTVDELASTVDTDAKLPLGARERRAKDDLNGVARADVLWLLAPTKRGASGAWTEFGYALGMRHAQREMSTTDKPLVIVVSGPTWQRTIFTSQADFGHLRDEVAYEHVLRLAGVA